MYPVVQFIIGTVDPAERFARPFTLVYDGDCKVCSRLAKLLRKWDRNGAVSVIPSHTPGVRARFPWIPGQAYRESIQLVGPGGETLQGAAAVEALLDLMPKGRLVSWVFSIPFMRPLAERAYRWFARHRYRFGCGQHCQSRPLDVMFEEWDDDAAHDDDTRTATPSPAR